MRGAAFLDGVGVPGAPGRLRAPRPAPPAVRTPPKGRRTDERVLPRPSPYARPRAMSNGRAARSLPCPRPTSPDCSGGRPPVQECAPAVHRLRLNGLGLGPTTPELTIRAREPLGFRCGRFSRPSVATHTGIRTPRPSTRAHARASQEDGDAPLPTCGRPRRARSAASAVGLAPLDCRRDATRPVSCYALFQGWLLLGQPPGCLGRDTSLPTEPTLRGLSRRSGLFPSRRWSLAPTV